MTFFKNENENESVNTERKNLMPVLFLPHGGGPMPLLGESNHLELINFLQSVTKQISQPTSILVITAHWEESCASISSKKSPEMFYDYYGFPSQTYTLKYPAPGNPELAENIFNLLTVNGIKSQLDSARDFDHGTFVPLMLMYPNANIPVVQLSLMNNFNPEAHIKMGKALATLREKGVLIIGSGMSFHNMQAFFSGKSDVLGKSEQFDQWLTETLTSKNLSSDEKNSRLANWKLAPEARFCHPREEHLLPLHVCFGAGSASSPVASKIFSGALFNTKISGFSWT